MSLVLLGIALILAIILVGIVLFAFRPPTALVLPCASISIALIAFLPNFIRGEVVLSLSKLFTSVIGEGMARLSMPIIAVFLGAVIAQQVSDAGVTNRILTYASEFAGDSVFFLTITLLIVTALLFTNIGGLGAVIMVASTIVPLMLAMGIDKLTAGGVFLMGLSMGGILNPVNWQFYISILQLTPADVIPFALSLFGIFFLVAVAFITYRIHRSIGFKRGELAWLGVILLILAGIATLLLRVPIFLSAVKVILFWLLLVLVALLCFGLLLKLLLPRVFFSGQVNALSVSALIFPVLLLLLVNLGESCGYIEGLELDIVSALFTGVAFAHFSTLGAGAEVNRLMKALFEGFRLAIAPILLLLGIGMLLMAVTLPEVTSAVQPIVQGVIPRGGIAYVLGFTILSPLALYRGPLNLYGMGSGIMGLIHGTGILPPTLNMGAFFSVGMMQGVCDPTNTHNAWLAGFLGVRVIDLTKVTIAFVGAIVFFGLILAQVIF